MTTVLKWVCDVAVYLVLVTIILQVIPKRFRKYISFFTGILLIILVINPVTKLFDADTSLAGYFEMGEIQQQISDLENMIKLTQNVSEERLIERYSESIEENITELLKEYGFQIININVEWKLDNEAADYGSISGISLVLDEKRTQGTITIEPIKIAVGEQTKDDYTREEVKEMKKKIASFYNLEEAHINIMIQR